MASTATGTRDEPRPGARRTDARTAPPLSDLRTAALRGTFWSGVQQVGDKGVRLVVYLLLARLLSPRPFGLVALATAYVDFLQLFRNQGVTAAIVQRDDLRDDHLDSAFWGALAFGAAMALAGIASAPLFAQMADQPELAPIVRWLSLAFVLGALGSVQEALLRRHLRFRALAVRAFVGQVVAGAVGIGAALAGSGVWSLVAMLLVDQAVGGALLWRASPWRPRLHYVWARHRELLGFGISMLGVELIRFGRDRADNLLIGFALGATALGYYSIAWKIINGISGLVMGTVGSVAWSTFSRLQREPRRLSRAIVEAAQMVGLVTWPVFLGAAATASVLVGALLGESWAPGGPVLAALAFAAVARSVAGLQLTAMTAVGAIRRRIVIEAITATVILLAILATVSRGIVPVAWAYAISMMLLLPATLAIASRALPLDALGYVRTYRIPLVASLLMLGPVILARVLLAGRLDPALELALLVGLGGVVYIGSVRLIAPDAIRRVGTNARIALTGWTPDDDPTRDSRRT